MLHSLGTPMEKELNPPELLRDEKIECMIPDEIFENVNKNMRYQPLHGPNKNQVEPLVPRRLFVVNDNIEVLETRDINEYSVIDRQSYLTRMEESGNKGNDITFLFIKVLQHKSQLRVCQTEISGDPA